MTSRPVEFDFLNLDEKKIQEYASRHNGLILGWTSAALKQIAQYMMMFANALTLQGRDRDHLMYFTEKEFPRDRNVPRFLASSNTLLEAQQKISEYILENILYALENLFDDESKEKVSVKDVKSVLESDDELPTISHLQEIIESRKSTQKRRLD